MNDKKRNKTLIAGLLLGMFFASLDQTIVGTAMPRIIGELGGLDILTWVSIAYMLTSTSIVPIAGKLADIFGRRIIYDIGIFFFMLGSALCGLSQNMTELIIFRGIQGIGGGILMPMSATIVGDIFTPEERGKWQGIFGALFGLSSIIGPLVGGWLVDHTTWRWVFYINLPFGLLSAAAIYIGLHGEKPLKDKVSIDYSGAITLTSGVVALLLALTMGGKDFPWDSLEIIGLLSASAILMIAFFAIEKKAADPVLSLNLFRNRVFRSTNMVGFLMGMGMFGVIMFLPLYMQGVIGMSATQSGSLMIPMVFSMIFTNIISGRLITKLSFRSFFMTGMALDALGFYFLSSMAPGSTIIYAILYIILIGAGMGMIMPITTIAIQNEFPPEQRGVATSSTQFFRSIGATLGMAVFGALLNFKSIGILQNTLFPKIHGVKELSTGHIGTMIEKAHTNPQSLFNILLKPDEIHNLPGNVQELLLNPLRFALGDSLHLVFFAAMLVGVAGMVVSYTVGSSKVEKRSASKDIPEVKIDDNELAEES